MPSNESGDPTNYPTAITIPSDGDGPGIKAADVNVAFEGLADRTAWLRALAESIGIKVSVFTSSGTYVVPAGVTNVILIGYGGGGGGGVGAVGVAIGLSQLLRGPKITRLNRPIESMSCNFLEPYI